jgi:REP-associated tyrosine transposase
MPRIRRTCPPGAAQHVLNRGNNRRTIFHKIGDYLAFLRLMAEAQTKIPLLLLAYCLMPNHFHFIVLPESAAALSAYMRWLMNAHVRQYHQHYETCGTGHIYQGRFKNFPVQTGSHLLNVWKYVEGNALRAGLVRRGEDWRWSSLSEEGRLDGPELCESPIVRPGAWVDYVNEELSLSDLKGVRRSVRRGAPYGDEDWTASVAKAHGLEFTLHRPGRPGWSSLSGRRGRRRGRSSSGSH